MIFSLITLLRKENSAITKLKNLHELDLLKEKGKGRKGKDVSWKMRGG